MHAFVHRLTNKKSVDFADQIGDLFKTLPHLPKNISEILVKIAPIFALIGAVLGLLASPILGLLSIVSFLTLNPMIILSILVASVIALLNALILFLAFKPLQKRQFDGWMLLFWSDMLSIVQVAFHIFFGKQGFGSIIGILIGLYILYEMRVWYKK